MQLALKLCLGLYYVYTVTLIVSSLFTNQTGNDNNNSLTIESFKKFKGDTPSANKTKALRSVIECGSFCLSIQGCDGFKFDSSKSCEIYTNVQPATPSSIAPEYVYKRNDGTVYPVSTCTNFPGYEVMMLDGSPYCILVNNDLKTNADNARAFCGHNGGLLITLESRAKIDDFQLALDTQGRFKYEGYWVGLHDRGEEGVYVWEKTGEVIDVSNEAWDPHQPNGASTQNCAVLVYNRYIQDKECDKQWFVVCELDPATPAMTP